MAYNERDKSPSQKKERFIMEDKNNAVANILKGIEKHGELGGKRKLFENGIVLCCAGYLYVAFKDHKVLKSLQKSAIELVKSEE